MTHRLNFDAVVTALIAVVVVAAGCFALVTWNNAAEGARIWEGDGEVGGAWQAAGAGKYSTMYAGGICLDRLGTVTITAVKPIRPTGGLRVTDFSVYERGSVGIGLEDKQLADIPEFAGTHSLSYPCAAAGSEIPELAIELFKPTTESAGAQGFFVYYESSGHERLARVRWRVRMCDESLDARTCHT